MHQSFLLFLTCSYRILFQKKQKKINFVSTCYLTHLQFCSVQFSSVAQSCPTPCDPMDGSASGLPVHHQLPKLAQTHVHWVSDAIQPSHPLSSPTLSRLQSFPASGSFPMSQLFTSGGRRTGLSIQKNWDHVSHPISCQSLFHTLAKWYISIKNHMCIILWLMLLSGHSRTCEKFM